MRYKLIPILSCMVLFYIRLITKVRDKEIRRESAWALGMITNRSTIPVLIDALDDEAWEVRDTAAKSLGRFKDARTIPALIKALKDPVPNVAISAAAALGEIGTPAKAALMAIIKNPKVSVSIRELVRLYSLGGIKEVSAQPDDK